MMSWMQEYWYLCLIALIIGVATGWWIWARYAAEGVDVDYRPATATPAAPPVLEPVRPEIPPAEPVKFAAAEPIAVAPVAAAMPTPAPVVDPEPVHFASSAPADVPVAAGVAAGAAAGAAPAIAAAVGASDDLELIKGVGPKLNALLNSLGVRRFDQIAAWNAADIAEVDQHLGSFRGRITRDNWPDQAGYLARGDTAGFEARYGAVGSEIKNG